MRVRLLSGTPRKADLAYAKTKISVGDFISIYASADDVDSEDDVYFGKITGYNEADGTLTYELSSAEEIENAVDLYTKPVVEGDDLISKEEEEEIESLLLLQVENSGFAEDAAFILADLATKTNGFRNMDGVQVLLSDENGNPLSDDMIEMVYNKMSAKMQNIVLIGMPGSGKSTVAYLLAKQLERTFVDAVNAYYLDKNLSENDNIVSYKKGEKLNTVSQIIVDKYLRDFYLYYQKYKEENHLQSFDDMLRNVREAVLETDSELLKRLKEKYIYAIIDEFQDTNQVQFDIFEKVFLSEGHNIIVVGDPKQSIYAYQGADVNVYQKAVSLIESKGEMCLKNEEIDFASHIPF